MESMECTRKGVRDEDRFTMQALQRADTKAGDMGQNQVSMQNL
jgi:hypothetical protein